MKAKSAAQLLRERRSCIDFSDEWRAAFGFPEAVGSWFVWGQSGNGKSSFMMQLAKELCRHNKVLYNSLEEGTALSFLENLRRHGMTDVGGSFLVVEDSYEELVERLKRRRSARVVIIDSLQYFDMDFAAYMELARTFSDKLFIFVSQARGRMPEGRIANRIQHAAMLKIWVEGYRAISNGRFFGELGYYTIWKEGAERYWGKDNKE